MNKEKLWRITAEHLDGEIEECFFVALTLYEAFMNFNQMHEYVNMAGIRISEVKIHEKEKERACADLP